MRRPVAASLARLLAPWLAAALPLAAQQPPESVLLLRDPSGQPVAGARGVLLMEPAVDVPALASIAHRAPGGPPEQRDGVSDPRGVLRFSGAGAARGGTALVTTDAGLGALVPRLLPGTARRIAMQPMGEVTTGSGSEPFVLHAAARGLDGRRIVLPAERGASVRLPAGEYEVWAHGDDGWIWQRLELAPGQRCLLHFGGPAQALRRVGSARVHPAGWPELELLGDGADRCLLRGAALAAPLVAHDPDTGLVIADRVPGPPGPMTLDWPPSQGPGDPIVVELAGDGAVAQTTRLYVARRSDSGAFTVLAAVGAGADDRFRMPRVGGGDDWLLAVAAQRPVVARPWSPAGDRLRLELAPGVPLAVECRDPLGDPAIDVRLEYVPAFADAAALLAHTDARGRANLGAVQAPGTLRVSDERFANQTIALDLVPREGLVIALAAGARIEGRIRLPDGAPAAGVVVTLRDLRGELRPAQRAVLSDANGAFGFGGLDESADHVLFATDQRAGRTWSAKLPRVRAGEQVSLVLRDEDPQLLPPGSGR